MSSLLILLIGLSVISLIIITFFHTLKSKEWKKFLISLLIIILLFILLNLSFNFPIMKNDIVSKGDDDNNELHFLIILYLFMILGMISQHFYKRFGKPKTKRDKFDLGLFLVPIFASPIVFIPLFAAFQNAQVDLTGFSQSSLMIYLVAFENGFFWKEIVNKK